MSSGPIFHIYIFVNGHCLGWKSHSKRMKGFSKPIKLNSSESFRAIHALKKYHSLKMDKSLSHSPNPALA